MFFHLLKSKQFFLHNNAEKCRISTRANLTPDKYSFFTAFGKNLVFTFFANVACQKIPEAHTVTVTFKNIKEQRQIEEVVIPVIYGNFSFSIIL